MKPHTKQELLWFIAAIIGGAGLLYIALLIAYTAVHNTTFN